MAGSDRNIPLENLEIWHRAAEENRQLRLLQIAAMGKDAPPLGEDGLLPPLPLPPCNDQAAVYRDAVAMDERMALLTSVPHPLTLPRTEELKAAPAAPRTARLAGAVFERALQRFMPLLGTVRPVYLSSLSELLEEVASGNADFALLPIEDARGVRFLHFYEELDRLELHVTHVCDVRSEESDARSRFALISKQYRPNAKVDGILMLEYRLSGQDDGALARLLMAAERANVHLFRVDSLPDPSFEDGYTYHIMLTAAGENSAALLHTYLSAALPRAALVSSYIYLKEGK